MNKSEFIEKFSKELDVAKTTAAKNFNAVTKCLAKSIKNNDELRFVGFGIFKAKKAKEVKTPRGTMAKVPEQRKVSFSLGSEFKAVVNGK